MKKPIDITGFKVNKITALYFSCRKNGIDYWMCQCDCGTIKEIAKQKLSKNTELISCGCVRLDKTRNKHIHGMSKTRFYGVWNDMMMRCYNHNRKKYEDYGGRGIKVCKRWHTFLNFYTDMFNGYKRGLSLERDNVNGNYSPRNCRWIPVRDQKYNKRKPIKWLTINGERILVNDAANKYNVPFRVIYDRISKGWSDYECVFGIEWKYLKVDGELVTVKDLCQRIKVSKSALFYRIAKGHPLDKCALPKDEYAIYLKSLRA